MNERRTWTYRGHEWPYDEATSAEIEARLAECELREEKLGEHALSFYDRTISDIEMTADGTIVDISV